MAANREAESSSDSSDTESEVSEPEVPEVPPDGWLGYSWYLVRRAARGTWGGKGNFHCMHAWIKT